MRQESLDVSLIERQSGCHQVYCKDIGNTGSVNGHGAIPTSGRNQAVARLVAEYVARDTGTTVDHILAPIRGAAEIARARQITAYLLHTVLTFSLTEIAEVFSKDRSTIGHACRLIEDLRDKPEFDARMARLEDVVVLVRQIVNG